VRVGEGFAGDEHQVTIYVVLNNDGSTNLHGVVADVLIDGEAVASSAPVDVPSGGTKTVDIHVPRQYVVDVRGERPVYTGEFSLRATDLSGTTAFFNE
jgi:archaellum component FlaF (FlaF/FlaG flagellin family)